MSNFANHILCVAFLATYGCQSDQPDASEILSRTVDQELAEAAAVGDIAAMDAAIAAGADVNAVGVDGKNPLFFAYYTHRNKVGFEHLLENGADPNQANDRGQSMMNYAASDRDDSAWLQMVLAHGGDPDLRQQLDLVGVIKGQTPIFDALYARAETNVEILVEHGADVNVVDQEQGFSPLLVASAHRNPVMAKWLLEHGADWTHRNKSGTGLAEAEIRHLYDSEEFPEAAEAHQWILDFLVEKGVDLEAAEERSREIYGENFRRGERRQ